MDRRSGPVLVTGASSGIGRTIVQHLSEQGHEVIATARAARDIESLGRLPHVRALRLDVTRDEEVRDVVAALGRSGRGLYGLVNNAGIAEIVPLIDTSVDALHRLLEVNLYGMHRMVCGCFPFLAESRGRVVNIGSTNGFLADAFAGAYCISKFAVEAYTDVLRAEFRDLGISVSVVEPGDFRSNILASFVAREGNALAKRLDHSPLREAARREIAELTESPGELDRTKYPEPEPVAEAVTDALFSMAPRPRYLVASPREVDEVMAEVFQRVRQLNEGQAHEFTIDELVERLRSATPGRSRSPS